MDKIKTYIAFWAVSIFWGTTYLGIRIGVEVLPPFLFGGIRWVTAGLILVSYFKIRGHSFPRRADLKNIAISATILIGAANSLLIWAEKEVTSGLAALIFATFPFWMAGMGAILPQGEKINLKKLTGIIIGFLGILLLFQADISNMINREYLFGILMVFLAAFAWAGGTIFSKYKFQGSNSMMNVALQMLIGGLVQSVLGISSGELGELTFTTQGLYAMLYLIIFGSIVGFVAYSYALSKLSPSKFSMYGFINPVIAVFLGWAVLGERLDMSVIIATGLILFGIAIVMTDKKGDVVMPTSKKYKSRGYFSNYVQEINRSKSKVNI